MRNFLNKVLSFVSWLWKRPETQEALTALQSGAWLELKEIAYTAIAEAKAGNFTSGEEKRNYAIQRIQAYLLNRTKSYPESVIRWIVEHSYQRFI